MHSKTREMVSFTFLRVLGYGVMVTLQILVLSFLVRVRVSQHNMRGIPFRMPFLFVCSQCVIRMVLHDFKILDCVLYNLKWSII